jgi:hypothetical protein
MYLFYNKANFYGEFLALCPTPKLIPYICRYPPRWRPFLHLQPEDVPCHGDKDPFILDSSIYKFIKYTVMQKHSQ